MTTLTPLRDSFDEAMRRARQSTAALPPGDRADDIERTMCLDAMESVVGAVSDLMDMNVPFDRVQCIFANALSNLLVTHALSLADGNRQEARRWAIQTLNEIIGNCRESLNGTSTVEVIQPIRHPPGGHA